MSSLVEPPVCRWRGDALAEDRFACTSPKLVVGAAGVSAEACRTCYCRDHEADVALLALRAAVERRWAAGTGGAVRCRHRGAVQREQPCSRCPGAVRLKVLACAKHGECTLTRALPGLACCATCADRDPEGTGPAKAPGPLVA